VIKVKILSEHSCKIPKKIRIIQCVLIFLFLNAFLALSSQACGCLASCFEGADAHPVKTQSEGGTNSPDNPLILIKVRRCTWWSTDHYSFVIGLGESVNPPGTSAHYNHYHAEINTTSEACTNACTYVGGCDPSIREVPPLNQCSGWNTSFCDPQLASATLKMCSQSKQKMKGICAYRTPSAWWPWGPSSSNKVKLEQCYPIPNAMLPYPFCKVPIKKYSILTVLRMCKIGETPYRTLSGSTKECVYPAPSNPSLKNTFMNPCVRVTYYNNPLNQNSIKGNTSHNKTYNIDYTKYYTGDGTNYEFLYVNKSAHTKFANPDTKVRFSTIYNDISDDGTTIPLTPFGYNKANYIDICGAINATDGSITMSGNNTLADQYGNKRKLKLTVCQDPKTGANICKPNSLDISSQKSVCVFEVLPNGKEVPIDCVIRAEMHKPSVGLCVDDKTKKTAFNDRTNSCMDVTVDKDYEYQFKGDINNCTDTQPGAQAGGPKQICTLQTKSPNLFGFQAIFTNRCYVNALSINQHNNTNNKICYKNASSCNVQRNAPTNCSNCDIDEYCAEFSPATPPSQFPSVKKVVGAERLCLYGYTEKYASLSNPWCNDGKSTACNRVCANTTSQTYGSQTVFGAYIDIGNRIMPKSTTPSPLAPPSCAYSHPTSEQDEAKYRVRNPVEEGLCVDAYTIKFNKECMPQKPSKYLNKVLCGKIRTFCSKTEDQKHYTHFDECQLMFKTCLGPSAPTEKQKLSDGTVYTCGDIQTFATTSDTFKPAYIPIKPVKPKK
jgi:hypothetical protein